MPLKKKVYSPGKTFRTWNTNKTNGWHIYKKLTEKNSRLDQIATGNEKDPEVLMKSIDRELNSVKFRAFGKVKVKKPKTDEVLDSHFLEKERILKNPDYSESKLRIIDEKIVEELQTIKMKSINDELEKLHSVKERIGKAAAIFGIKDKLLGRNT